MDALQSDASGFLDHLVVVDTGDSLSFFIGQIPYPDPQRIAVMEDIAARLTVEET